MLVTRSQNYLTVGPKLVTDATDTPDSQAWRFQIL
jgi:hypothetical protein